MKLLVFLMSILIGSAGYGQDSDTGTGLAIPSYKKFTSSAYFNLDGFKPVNYLSTTVTEDNIRIHEVSVSGLLSRFVNRFSQLGALPSVFPEEIGVINVFDVEGLSHMEKGYYVQLKDFTFACSYKSVPNKKSGIQSFSYCKVAHAGESAQFGQSYEGDFEEHKKAVLILSKFIKTHENSLKSRFPTEFGDINGVKEGVFLNFNTKSGSNFIWGCTNSTENVSCKVKFLSL